MPWAVIEEEDSVHVIPTFGKEHQPDDCWCDPKIEQYDLTLVVHNVDN